MLVFSAVSVILTRSDFDVPREHYLMSSIMLMLPPLLCAVVTFAADKHRGDPGTWECLMPVALFLKGIDFIYLLWLLQVKESQKGTDLPMSFRDVLFVDVFGWANHSGTAWRTSGHAARSHYRADVPGQPATLASRCTIPTARPTRPEDVVVRSGLRSRSSQGPTHLLPVREETIGIAHGAFSASTFMGNTSDRVEVHSGHAGDKPGAGPWRALRLNTLLVSGMWITASVTSLANITKQGSDEVFVLETLSEESSNGLVAPRFQRASVLYGTEVPTSWHGTFQRPKGLDCDDTGMIFVTTGLDSSGQHAVLVGRRPSDSSGKLNETGPMPFEAVQGCQVLRDRETRIQDIAITAAASNGSFEVVLLAHNATSLARCTGIPTGSSITREPMGTAWLQDRDSLAPQPADGPGLRIPEALTSVSAVPCQTPRSTSRDCLAVGTTAGRLVQLRHHQPTTKEEASSWLPYRLLQDRLTEVPGAGSLSLLPGGRYIGLLQQMTGIIRLLDLEDGGAEKVAFQLPQRRGEVRGRWGSLCVGGGAIYALEAGETPGLWQFQPPRSMSHMFGGQRKPR